MLNIIPNFNLL